MHSENLAIQHRSIEVFQQLADAPKTKSCYSYALKHQDIIQRFGHFPHRNALLEQENTLEEAE